MCVCTQVWLPETPASLIQAGRLAEGRYTLQQIRGRLVNVDQEFDQILKAAEVMQVTGWLQVRGRSCC